MKSCYFAICTKDFFTQKSGMISKGTRVEYLGEVRNMMKSFSKIRTADGEIHFVKAKLIELEMD